MRSLIHAACMTGIAVPGLVLSVVAEAQQPAETVTEAAAPATTAAVPEQSSGGMEEVVVTAQKRAEKLQEIPIAMSALSADDLATQGITDIQGVVANTPTLYQAPYPSSNSTISMFMRGQGSYDPMQITRDGAIGIYQDGIYNSRPQIIAFDLADIERVEVLRGPQGTLYGRNTTGGAVNIVSKAPTGEFGVRQIVGYGDRQQFRSVTSLDLPAFGDFSAKVTLASGHDDGYVKNIGPSNNYNSKDYTGGRVALRWQASDDITADYSFSRGLVNSTPGYLSTEAFNGATLYQDVVYHATRYDTYRAIDLPESLTTLADHTLILNWELAPNLTIKSLTGYRQFKADLYSEYAEAFGFNYSVVDRLESDQFSQEIQLIGSVGERIQYVGGVFYYDEQADHRQVGTFVFAPGADPQPYDRYVDGSSKSQAVYAQLTWTPPILEDRLDVTVGGRYTKDKRDTTRDYVFNGFVLDDGTNKNLSFSKFTPSITAAYRWTDDLNTYAKIATGYKAGGTNEAGGDFLASFDPEELTTYEAGLKAEWFDRHLRTNFAVFYSDYSDIQLDTSPDPDNISIVQTINAGEAEIKGAEIDITFAPIDDLTFDLSYAYLDTEVTEVNVPGLPEITADKFSLAYAPKNSYNAAVDYVFPRFDKGSVAAHLDYSWKDRVFNSGGTGPGIPGNEFYSTPSYFVFNGRITLSYEWSADKEPVQIALWGRNLLDDRHPIYTVGNGSTQGYTSSAYNYGEPLSFGVEFTFAL